MKRILTAALLSVVVMSPAFSQTSAPSTTTAPTTQEVVAPKAKARVGVIKLTEQLLERPASFQISFASLNNSGKASALSALTQQLTKAAKDPALSGLFFDLSSFSLTLNQAHELGQHFTALRKAGKRVAIYSADFDTATYLLASHADTVIMPENGNVMIPGVSLQMMFFKGTLEKLNLTADFIQVGKFKGASEPFTRTSASPEYKAQIEGLVDGMYNAVVSQLAANRPNLTEDDVKKAIDEGWITGQRAKQIGLIDQTLPREKIDAWLDSQFPAGAALVEDYGQPKKKALDLDSPFALFSMMGAKPPVKSKDPAVAVIYATGQIMPDSPNSENNTELVTPTLIRKAVDIALKDPLVKSIVLRVDSPGGSASASDEIWSVLKAADAKKPVTVSLGRVAASGGYYIACSGRSITADPHTITGSIGVVAGKIVIKGLMDKVGLNIEPISRGKHAEMLSMLHPFTDEERTYLTKQMEDVYTVFTGRVTSARGTKIKNIDEVAHGRLFTGDAAKKAGLVDNVGTLQDTIAASAKTAGIDAKYQVLILPESKTLADIIREGLTMDVSIAPTFNLEMDAALKAVPAEYRREALRALNLITVLKKEQMLMSLPAGIVEGH